MLTCAKEQNQLEQRAVPAVREGNSKGSSDATSTCPKKKEFILNCCEIFVRPDGKARHWEDTVLNS